VLELSHVMEGLRRAQALLAEARVKDWSDARAMLQRVVHVCPQAAWIREMIGQLDAGLQVDAQIQSSPLGLVAGYDDDDATLPAGHVPPVTERIMNDLPEGMSSRPRPARALPARFLLQVDGSGSYLVVCEDRVTVGPGGSSGRHDVNLQADSGLPYGTIERHEDDYFLLSDGSVKVNGQRASRSLLRHGDKVALSVRCGFSFLRPNAASGTALLQLSGTRLDRSDARRVILLQREIVLGSGPSAHVRVNGLARNIVLYAQNGTLYCRSAESVLCEGREVDRREGIPMDRNVQIGDVGVRCVSDSG